MCAPRSPLLVGEVERTISAIALEAGRGRDREARTAGKEPFAGGARALSALVRGVRCPGLGSSNRSRFGSGEARPPHRRIDGQQKGEQEPPALIVASRTMKKRAVKPAGKVPRSRKERAAPFTAADLAREIRRGKV